MSQHYRNDAHWDIAKIRDNFPITRKWVFLDNCAVSPLPAYVELAVRNFLASRMTFPTGSTMKQHMVWNSKGTETRDQAAKLIGADRDEIGLVGNTTQGLNIVATMINWRRGDNVVVNDLEFPGNVFPWMHLQRKGVRIKVVKNVNGEIRIEDLRKLIDHRTRLIAISWVQWTNGFRSDLKQLSKEVAGPEGIHLCVDGMQGVGCLRLDAPGTGIDFMACGGYKWLCGPFGSGFLYVRRELLERFEPAFVGAGSTNEHPSMGAKYVESPAFDPFTSYGLGLRANAERFENPGSPNSEGVHGLHAALKYLNRIGIGFVEKRVLRLTDLLIEGLEEIGVRITSPLREGARSGIVAFTGAHKTVERLLRNRVVVSLRYCSGQGGVRVSPHFYNTEEEVEKLVGLLREDLLKRG